MIVWTCAHHYFVFVGATDPYPKNQETKMTPPCVLITRTLMILTVGEAILLEGKVSMHVDGINIGVSAIY